MLTTVAEPLSGHQPYLLQVLCCHLFDECIREDVPIITTRLVAKIVRRRVLRELGDYFASQWATLSTEHGDAIKWRSSKTVVSFPWKGGHTRHQVKLSHISSNQRFKRRWNVPELAARDCQQVLYRCSQNGQRNTLASDVMPVTAWFVRRSHVDIGSALETVLAAFHA